MVKKSKNLCHLLREMVKDEHKAYTREYPKLIKASHGKVPKRFAKDIRRNIKDEHRHYGVVDGYYRYVCGRQR